MGQLLDAMRRRQAYYHEALAFLLLRLFVQNMRDYPVHPLTQASWCLVVLDALDMAGRLPPELLPQDSVGLAGSSEDGVVDEEGAISEVRSNAGYHVMRLVFERMEDLSKRKPLTPTETTYVQMLVRTYRARHELDFMLMPPHVRAFCKALFVSPTSVVSSVGRQRARAPRR